MHFVLFTGKPRRAWWCFLHLRNCGILLSLSSKLSSDWGWGRVDKIRYQFHCLPCGKNLSCHHQGTKDVEGHHNTETHLKNYAATVVLWVLKKSPSFLRLKSKISLFNCLRLTGLWREEGPNLNIFIDSLFPDPHSESTTAAKELSIRICAMCFLCCLLCLRLYLVGKSICQSLKHG